MLSNFGSSTSVTRLRYTPNMADPLSIKSSDSHLNDYKYVFKCLISKGLFWISYCTGWKSAGELLDDVT